MEKPSRCSPSLPSPLAAQSSRAIRNWPTLAAAILLLLLNFLPPLHGRESKKKADFGLGLSMEISSPENTVLQALEAVVNDGIIQGSKEYNKDKFVDKASPATSSTLFDDYKGTGKVYYKVREQVLAPVNFKESNDQGTLAVRYIVENKGAQKTLLRIDAVFVEDFRRVVHPSNGSVESGEYQDIQDRVDTLEAEQKQAAEGERHRQEELAKQTMERKIAQERDATLARSQSANTPEQKIANLRRQVERIVKAPGAQLKSAPFHSATNLKTLDTGSEVVILIATPYWFGVETENGEHGWINHSQMEPLP
ncbi:MAG TPA: hypothetical protein VKR57_00180 [Terriglobales bacterium]|nr:hypothetical protein [Terriglobales bacterium]